MLCKKLLILNVVIEVNNLACVKTCMFIILFISTEEYKDVQSQFSSKVPCVLFTDQVQGLRCQLTIGSDLAQETSHLLLMYSRCDPRFKKLAVVFRYWAKVSNFNEATIRKYIYNCSIQNSQDLSSLTNEEHAKGYLVKVEVLHVHK